MDANPLLSIKAKDILINNIIYTTEDEKIREIESKMFKKGIGGVPVIRNSPDIKKEVVGMLTHRDIILAKHSLSIGGMVARDLTSHDVICVHEDSDLLEILKKMRDHNIERIPVVNGNGSLLGMIMHKNLLFKITETLEKLI